MTQPTKSAPHQCRESWATSVNGVEVRVICHRADDHMLRGIRHGGRLDGHGVRLDVEWGDVEDTCQCGHDHGVSEAPCGRCYWCARAVTPEERPAAGKSDGASR